MDSSGSKINMQEKKTSTEKCHNNTRKNTNLMAKHHQSVAEPRVCSNVDGTEMNIPTPEVIMK